VTEPQLDYLPSLQLRRQVVDALTAHNHVNAIACFGSLAKGAFDEHSDVDLIVEASGDLNGIRDAGIFREARYHRPFSGGLEPDGRYWFLGYSVYVKLDISFHDRDQYASLLSSGDHSLYISPPVVELWRRPVAYAFSAKDRREGRARSAAEEEASSLVYHVSSRIKRVKRGQSRPSDLAPRYRRLRELNCTHQATNWVGGDLDALVREVLDDGVGIGL
jgi:hypothetical protein